MDHGLWIVVLVFAVLDGVIWCWVGCALWCWVAGVGFGDGETETRDERQRRES